MATRFKLDENLPRDVHVSVKYINRYLREFTFRANHREMQNAMFDLLIGAV
jgi:hypothetical protein